MTSCRIRQASRGVRSVGYGSSPLVEGRGATRHVPRVAASRRVAGTVALDPKRDRIETFESARTLIRLVNEAVVEASGIHDDTLTYDVVTERVAAALTSWVRDLDGILPEEFVQPSSRGYGRRALHVNKDGLFGIIIMAWAPGQSTAIHDHDDMWCVECVYDGRVRIDAYDTEAYGREDLYNLVPAAQSFGDVGESGQLIPPKDVHKISNDDPAKMAVTIHVYGGHMEKCSCFRPRPEFGDDVFEKESRSLFFTRNPNWCGICG
ncbi:hypothetical protein A3770_02p13000 [Chloropicon primus]|uniref:Cysteine dioxygenase n=2 Tax=Chloropicon primus TaxID=1764295 RepID=A0A5B8MHE3_9CHLO|nr:hypothetical protein A3770_02p13000 [Chloropicon primus]|eukprot:QDZ18782.1 hypothetical protein A3770_02p13000 [Chloropicon primus]